MKQTERQRRQAARAFALKWTERGNEKAESQAFWLELLHDVLGVDRPTDCIRFEEKVKVDATGYIDAYIPHTRVLIEQKGRHVNMQQRVRQSDGSLLTPFDQARRYILALPLSKHPRWVVTCNFWRILVYDMEHPSREPQQIDIANLERDHHRLDFLVDAADHTIAREVEISTKAGRLVSELYDHLRAQYINPDAPETLRSLNILCVRLVFLFYAEDSDILPGKDMFGHYIEHIRPADIRTALIELFRVLNTPAAERSPYLAPDLAAFPYTNGGLFAEEIEIPAFTLTLKDLVVNRCSLQTDWSPISPTIFGAVFESTLNPDTRRHGGMHYTSIENIHKLIDPLFLDSLRDELNHLLLASDNPRRQRILLEQYQQKLASLRFFDPACGSGNFLTETYLSLRRLENRVIEHLAAGTAQIGSFVNPVRVSIAQFYGIELNDFAVDVARTALWISEAQMLTETARLVSHDLDFLPLHSYNHIRQGNALRTPWEEVVGQSGVDYIIGNPPFVGYSLQSREQKADMLRTLVDENGKPLRAAGKADYVSAWYYKAAALIHGTSARAAFVSSNSITQGEQVALVWRPLVRRYGLTIHFAHRTFRWDSEATDKAHVHCVIIGFHCPTADTAPSTPKYLFDPDGTRREVSQITPYLTEGEFAFIDVRKKPLSDAPEMINGGKPADGGNLILTEEEKNELLKHEPQAAPLIRPFMMGVDFINRRPRYCLWLTQTSPSLIRRCPEVMRRIEAVRDFRLASKKEATRRKADTPTLFDEVKECFYRFVAVPKVSSEKRSYIPIDYLSKEIIAGDKLFVLPKATLYHFAILISSVHMAWMRAVCGRLKSDYSYSNTIVYNNFPWPTPTEEQKAKIEAAAQAVLDARNECPDSSLADLYDPLTMPPALRHAHRANDRAVLQAYHLDPATTEADIVRHLFALYGCLTQTDADKRHVKSAESKETET